ncbi:MAG: hypothetical protein IH857_00670 [Deltaproteobacteria bacterium]|nr:hypothetical protein [Deltaproteobacteria bacterium]
MSASGQLTIVIRITSEGLQPPEIQAGSEAEEKAAIEILEKIQPCVDVADAILRKTSAGPKG